MKLSNYSSDIFFFFFFFFLRLPFEDVIFETSRELSVYPAGNYIFKVKNRNTKTKCEICSESRKKTLERRQ